MGILGGSPSIQMAGLCSVFPYKEKYMAEETLKEYALDSADAAYENTGD